MADGVLTAAGVAQFGIGVEGNPLLRFVAASAGFVTTLVGAKIVAITFATILHVHERHLALALLSLVYFFAAIVPWTFVLAMS